MPKMKTHKGVKKRFRLSATGKVMHRAAGTSHLNCGTSKKRRRNLRGSGPADVVNETMIQRALGKYSS